MKDDVNFSKTKVLLFTLFYNSPLIYANTKTIIDAINIILVMLHTLYTDDEEDDPLFELKHSIVLCIFLISISS
ncbi:hypothetical protein [Trichoplusia ni ascovirus 2c]|uniref:hypothetical protein n=1 Tax=Trichoplusia ni ascovirus 2c TaxID=328615 RepID=UPI0000E44257|nr:hypothetical protein TNAV2c_gp127 [Trichoplusia ni ascovirus 2c]ABF70644.1 hypothetical protein [Trichoplusia ni ascovirus 2c]